MGIRYYCDACGVQMLKEDHLREITLDPTVVYDQSVDIIEVPETGTKELAQIVTIYKKAPTFMLCLDCHSEVQQGIYDYITTMQNKNHVESQNTNQKQPDNTSTSEETSSPE